MQVIAIVVSVALCVAGYVYMFKSIQEQLQIQHEINLKLPPDQQFEPTFWSYWTWQKFKQLQDKLLPGDPRPAKVAEVPRVESCSVGIRHSASFRCSEELSESFTAQNTSSCAASCFRRR